MGKIVYIEDDLKSHDIIRVFSSILSDSEVTDLKQSRNKIVKIKEAVSQNGSLLLISDFTEAVDFIKTSNLNDSLLFIVDRNLYGDGNCYNSDNLPDDFDENIFHEREGDYIIYLLHKKNYNIDSSLYILTGNSDSLRYKPEFKYLLSENFKENNIIIKGSESNSQIKSVIDNIPAIRYLEFESILEKNLYYIKSMEREFGYTQTSEFLKLIQKELNTTTEIKGALTTLRQLFEKIGASIALKIESNRYTHPMWYQIGNQIRHSKGTINMQSIIDYLGNPTTTTKRVPDKPIEDTLFRINYLYNDSLKVNFMVYHYFKTAWEILSTLIHNHATEVDVDLTKYLEKQNGVESLKNIISILSTYIKELILWLELIK